MGAWVRRLKTNDAIKIWKNKIICFTVWELTLSLNCKETPNYTNKGHALERQEHFLHPKAECCRITQLWTRPFNTEALQKELMMPMFNATNIILFERTRRRRVADGGILGRRKSRSKRSGSRHYIGWTWVVGFQQTHLIPINHPAPMGRPCQRHWALWPVVWACVLAFMHLRAPETCYDAI